MELNLSRDLKKIMMLLLLVILPLLLILAGALTNFANAVYYILSIFWFGMGVVFYGVLN